MEFRILGPLEVLEDGRQIDLGSAKQRALLAVLLLHANEVVSTDRLIDALWEDDSPETGRKTLQVYVSQLRKALGKERLQTQAPGYMLRVEQDELDLARFQRLLAEGEQHEALSLWRGAPLSEFAYQRFAQAEIGRLDDLRLACLEDRVEADLAAGRHGALVGELEALVAEHPLRERLRGQVMLALYRSGRQAEALDVYQDARRALVDELGIEPSRGLRDLHQAILRQDLTLDLEPAAEAPADRPEAPSVSSDVAPVTEERAERKTVTVLHVDVNPAPAPGDRIDPEILRRMLTRAFGEITAAIEAHEGTIDAVTGSSISGVFGLPVVHEDDPLRATRAADEVRTRMTTLEDEPGEPAPLDVRIGVSTGEVITGSSSRTQLRATGAPMALAAQLAREAEPEGAVLDETTRRAVAGHRDGSRFVSPMIGREREWRRLTDAFEQADGDRSCQLFTLLGAAGVGKSRLVQEFLSDLDDRTLIARGRCLPYGEGITFWPVLEAVKDVAGLDDSASHEEVVSRLLALVDDEDEARPLIQHVSEAIGLADVHAGGEEGFTAVLKFFEALGRRRHLVVVFDDVHWGEETFLDLVEHVAVWSRGAPILLLCMARPELLDIRPTWGGGKLNATSVLLEPLSDDDCTLLVANLVGEADFPDEAKARIAGAAEGNPLFVEEMLSMLIDEGLLVREDGRWTAAGDLTAVPVPPTIHALLAARLDQLGGDERAAIESAAVEGKIFHEGSVMAGLASRGPAVSSALAALVRKELIRPEPPVFSGERAFRFRHLLIRDAAYESIPKEARATFHERHARWLEARVGQRAVEFEEIVGYHLERAFGYRTELGQVDEDARALGRQAAERLGNAGRRAFMRSDAPGGLNLTSRAVSLLSPDDPLRVELVPNVRVIQGISDLSWADRVLTDAVEAAATTGDRSLAAHALVQRGLLRLFSDADVTPQELFDVSQRAVGVFEELGDELGLARAWRLAAQSHYLERRAGLCAEASEKALVHARRVGDVFEEREIVEWLVIVLLLGPTPAVEAEAQCRRLLGQTTASSELQSQIVMGLAHVVAMQGRQAEAVELMQQSKRIMHDADEWIWIVFFWWAYVHLWQGDLRAAERELRPAYDALKRIGEKSHFSSLAHELSAVLYAQGRYEEAEQLTRECEQACRANDIHSQILWRSIRAKALARRRAFEEAEQLAREAVGLARTSDFLAAHADALADLAEVFDLSGARAEAADALEEAIGLYEQKGNVLAAGAARARLEDANGRA